MKKQILCVEDSPDMGELLSVILEDFDVTAVGTMLEARQKARSRKYSLIIIDYYLPDGNGAALCSKIRSFDRRTPILFSTSNPNFSETDARQLGANGTLHKHNPLFVNELLERARELVPA
jgi:DNA-binding response OmpR family regulator